MTPAEKLEYWLAQPPSEERTYWIKAMRRILNDTTTTGDQT